MRARLPLLFGCWLALWVAGAAIAAPGGRTPGAADSLAAQADSLFARAAFARILELVPSFLSRAEAERDSLLLGRALGQRGRARMVLGQREAGEADVDRAIAIAQALADTIGWMPAVHAKGFAHLGRREFAAAMQCFERRLELALAMRSPLDEAHARTSIGYQLHEQDQHEAARAHYMRAIECFRDAADQRAEITPLIGLGRVESALGDDRSAARCYQRAWVLARAVGDRMNEMWALNNLGVVEEGLGDLARASQYQQQAFELARELGSTGAIVVPAVNLANRAAELGDFPSAEAILAETRTLCEARGATSQLPVLDFHLAELHLKQGEYRSAASLLRPLAARPQALQAQHRDYVTMDLARVLAASDSLDAAITLLRERLERPGQPLFAGALPGTLLLLSRLSLQAGDAQAALECAERARGAALASGRRRSVVAAALRASLAQRALGRWDRARDELMAALDSMDAVRGGIGDAEWREVYGQEVAQSVVDAARSLLEVPGDDAATRERRAFEALQRVKARTLLDRVLRAPSDARALGGLAELQAALAPGELLVDFHLGRESAFCFAVRADSMRLVTLQVEELASRVRLLRGLLADATTARDGEDDPRLSAATRALGSELLGGLRDWLGDAERVFVAPDGVLAALPFGLLRPWSAGPMLLERCEVVQIPSASLLLRQRALAPAEGSGSARLIAIEGASGSLPAARREARTLAGRYGQGAAPVVAATPREFEAAASHAAILHVAAHASVVDRSPWESAIHLGTVSAPTADRLRGATGPPPSRIAILPTADSLVVARAFPADGRLRAWQIAGMHLSARLAVLSACETAGGRLSNGEGPLGLTTAFLGAGVPVVVATRWPVDDRATAELMESFYRRLAAGENVGAALRGAQLALREQPGRSHPFFWAGFTVVGDAALRVPLQESSGLRNRFALAAVGGLLLLGVAIASRWRRRGLAGR